MSRPETPARILRDHLEICAELHAVLLEENRQMRATGGPPAEDLLARKRGLLPRLDASLQGLRSINERAGALAAGEAAAVQEGRKRLMQLLMLDRENERLLLKASLPARLKAAYAPVVPGQVARAYGKFTAGRKDLASGGGAGDGSAPETDELR
jgi:hypothetical protein